jgi:hypothetical protein
MQRQSQELFDTIDISITTKKQKSKREQGRGVGAKMTEKSCNDREHRQVRTQLTDADETGRRNRVGGYKQTEPKESALAVRERKREKVAQGAQAPKQTTCFIDDFNKLI